MTIYNEIFEFESEPRINCFCCGDEHCCFCSENYPFLSNITFSSILLNFNDFLQLNSIDLDYIISQLKTKKYSCPECSSIEDSDYYCLTCEGKHFNGCDFLYHFLSENNIDKKEIEFLKEKIR